MRKGLLLTTIALLTGLAVPPAVAITHSFEVSRLTSDSTLRRGSSTGPRFNLSCPEGRVLIGINFHAGAVVDNVVGRCTAITAAGAWSGNPVFTGGAGGPGGTAINRTCPANHAVSGFRGRAAAAIDRLELECTALGSNGTFNTATRTMLSAVGGTGGNSFALSRCERPARSIIGRSTVVLHAFELACETNSPLITGATIGSNLAGATNILRTDSGTGDVACDVTVQRTGPLRIEPSNGLFQISSSGEMDNACGLPGFAVVTSQINWCGGIGSSIVGCARPGCLVVVPFGTGPGGNQLWAHEFGHTRALGHRNGTLTIMNDTINNGDRLNSDECGAYVNPVTAFFFSFLPAQEAQPDLPLEAFVAQTFVHGVPYEQAVKYGPAAVPRLIAILRDGSQESKWSTAATMLAMLDDPAGVDAVIQFIEKVNPTDPRSQRAWARNNAVVALGYAAGQSSKTRAQQYLMESLETDVWSKRGVLGARGSVRPLAAEPVEEDEEEELPDVQLLEAAIVGLALSGRPEARQRLEAFAGAPGRSLPQKDFVSGVLVEQAKVAQKGLATYDLERRARVADRAEAEIRARRGELLESPVPDQLAPGQLAPGQLAPGQLAPVPGQPAPPVKP